MYLITCHYSCTVYVLHIYRCIFFIWINYFEFFTYFCLTWCSIFCCSRCCLIIHHVLHLWCSFFTHCNIIYHILLQILFWFFFCHKMYIYDMYWYIYIYSYVKIILLYISSTYFSICYISYTWYLYTNALYIKILNSFFLPYVLSSTLLVFNAVTIVFSSGVYPFSSSACQVAFPLVL